LTGSVPKRSSSASPTSASGVTVKTLTVSAASADRNNANTYPVLGAKDSNPAYWKMTLTGEGVTCDDECDTTVYHGSGYVWDAGKTHDCAGQAVSAGNTCKYSY
jgi:hypothetical protein